jgi:hypothetical protein
MSGATYVGLAQCSRRSTITLPRATADDFPPPKSFELENRVARLEIIIEDMRASFETLNKRLTAIQAQLDHLGSRLTSI